MGAHCHAAFGLRWDSDVPLEQFSALNGSEAPADVVVREVEGPLPTREQLVGFDGASLCSDGVRFWARGEAIFDIYPPARIDWRRGPDWMGRFPPTFYGTLTALLLAWRGGVPIHGSAVEIDKRGYVICGESGAGKSTLAATLIASGRARLISDDLSLIERDDGGKAVLRPGRKSLRLFPATAENMAATSEIVRTPCEDKAVVLPPRTDPFARVKLTALLQLGGNTCAIPTWQKAALLDAQIFRPRWMRSIPGWKERFAFLHDITVDLPILSIDIVEIRTGDAFRARAVQALDRIQGLD